LDSKEGKRLIEGWSHPEHFYKTSSSEKDNSRDESLTVSFKARKEYSLEVQPINKNNRGLQFCYGRVMTEKLSKATLKKVFQESNADIDIIEEDDSFILQYKNQKPISISKKDGKFYSWHDGLSQQARIIWEILRKNGYIENPHRKCIYKKSSMWKDK
jgi:hypothetical protein